MSPSGRGPLRSLLSGGALVLGVLGFRACVGGPLVVEGATLQPSVRPGAWVWLWKAHRPVAVGDMVWVGWPATRMDGAYRVAAVGPARVEVEADGTVVVDGVRRARGMQGGVWRETMGDQEVVIVPGGPLQSELVVPADHVYVLSDARPIGGDSRVHGSIPKSAILGRIAVPWGT